jgi:replicative DNA helicase
MRMLNDPQWEPEVSTLGAVMLRTQEAADVYDRCAAIVSAEDFADGGHAVTWRAIGRLVEAGQPVDVVTVRDALERSGELETAGGVEYLCGLAEAVSTSVNVEHHAKIVAGYAKNRRHAQLAADAHARARAAGFDEADDALEQTVDALFAMSDRRTGGRMVTMCEATGEVLAELRPLIDSKQTRSVIGTPSGIAANDRLTRGWRPGHLYVIGARPGMGKTAFAVRFAKGAAAAGFSVLYASLEIPARDIAVRGLGSEAGVNTEALETAALKSHDIDALAQGVVRLNNYGRHVFLLDMPSASVAAVRSAVRRVKRTPNTPPLGLVIVDYLQLMKPPQRYPNAREREVAETSAGLLGVAKEESVPVVALSQLNRSCESRAEKRPEMADLRESGAIEQDASGVAFIYRDEVYNPDTEDKGIAEIIWRKNRLGRLGTARARFDKTCQRITDLERRDDPWDSDDAA